MSLPFRVGAKVKTANGITGKVVRDAGGGNWEIELELNHGKKLFKFDRDGNGADTVPYCIVEVETRRAAPPPPIGPGVLDEGANVVFDDMDDVVAHVREVGEERRCESGWSVVVEVRSSRTNDFLGALIMNGWGEAASQLPSQVFNDKLRGRRWEILTVDGRPFMQHRPPPPPREAEPDRAVPKGFECRGWWDHKFNPSMCATCDCKGQAERKRARLAQAVTA